MHYNFSSMRVLALESSCDESAAAVLDARAGLLAHELFSQVELHRAYGGVVPELASRDHVRRLLPLVRGALERAGIRPDRKSTRLNSSHSQISYAVFCLQKKKEPHA